MVTEIRGWAFVQPMRPSNLGKAIDDRLRL